jgi:hypothetical protein
VGALGAQLLKVPSRVFGRRARGAPLGARGGGGGARGALGVFAVGGGKAL